MTTLFFMHSTFFEHLSLNYLTSLNFSDCRITCERYTIFYHRGAMYSSLIFASTTKVWKL